MKLKMIAVFLMIVTLAIGCGAAKVSESYGVPAVAEEAARDYAEAPAAEPSGATYASDEAANVSDVGIQPRMIIYNGNMNIVVADTIKTQDDIVRLVATFDGYVSGTDSYAYESGLRSINMSLRVPAERFHEAMAALREMALEVNSESVGSQDVTQEYVDLESRLKALEAKEKRLNELMEKAEDTEAVLAVYQELSKTQMEIEQTKGQMQYLERSAAMATIDIHLEPDVAEKPVEVERWRPQATLKRAVEALIEAFQFLSKAVIWLVIWVLPVFAFVGLIIFALVKLFRLIFKRRKPRVKKGEAAQEQAVESESAPSDKG